MSLQFRALLDMVDTAVNPGAVSQAIRFFALDNGFEHHAYLSLKDPRRDISATIRKPGSRSI